MSKAWCRLWIVRLLVRLQSEHYFLLHPNQFESKACHQTRLEELLAMGALLVPESFVGALSAQARVLVLV